MAFRRQSSPGGSRLAASWRQPRHWIARVDRAGDAVVAVRVRDVRAAAVDRIADLHAVAGVPVVARQRRSDARAVDAHVTLGARAHVVARRAGQVGVDAAHRALTGIVGAGVAVVAIEWRRRRRARARSRIAQFLAVALVAVGASRIARAYARRGRSRSWCRATRRRRGWRSESADTRWPGHSCRWCSRWRRRTPAACRGRTFRSRRRRSRSRCRRCRRCRGLPCHGRRRGCRRRSSCRGCRRRRDGR